MERDWSGGGACSWCAFGESRSTLYDASRPSRAFFSDFLKNLFRIIRPHRRKGFEIAKAIRTDKVKSAQSRELTSRRRASALTDSEYCTELSWVFFAFSMFLSLFNTFFAIMYAIKVDLVYITYAAVPLPISMTWFALSLFMKPRRTDRSYYLCFATQYAFFVILPAIFVTIGDFRRGEYIPCSAGGFMVVASFIGILLGWKFRAVR